MGITVAPPAPPGSSTYPFSGSFTSTVQDGSSSAFYAGPSFALQVMSSTTTITAGNLVVTPGGSNTAISYAAGTGPYTIAATVTCTPGSGCPASGVETGLTVVWSLTGYPASTAFSFTPSSGSTDSTGTTSTTFQPSNHATDSGTVHATIGTSTVTQAAAAIVTKAGAPTKITFGAPFGATHYVTTYGPASGGATVYACVGTSLPCNAATGPITASIADQFGNPEDLSTLCTGTCVAYSVTITAVAGGGFFDTGAAHPTSVTCGAGLTCPTGVGMTTLTINYPYFQSSTYGAKGLLTAGATSTSPSFAAAGSSGNIVTSTFDAAVNQPAVLPASIILLPGPGPGTCGGAGTTPCAVAGKNVNITFALTNAQAGVPVTFYLNTATSSAGYAGTFAANNKQSFTMATNAAGFASALFAVDTTALVSSAKWFANFTRPVDGTPSGTMTKSIDTTPGGTNSVWTIAAAASTIKLKVFFTNNAGCLGSFTPLCNSVGSSAVGGLTLWIDGIFADPYGNTATNPGPNAVQVTLAASAGVLSATTVYIPAGGSDTLSSFGAIAWTLPAGSGTSLTLSASGVVSGVAVSGTKTFSTVSPNPTLLIKSPKATNGVVYSSSTGVVFTGNANVSLGYPTAAPGAVTISGSGITFSVDKGAAQSATVVTGAGTSKVTWSAGVFLTVGLHNITFTATDSKSNSVTSATWQILVDSSAPTIVFTTATGSTLTYGTSAKAVIFDTLGDLNTTSIAANYNGTAVAAANLVVTGTNTLGSNSTFQISINNLPAGKWVLTLSAKDYAGNSNPGVSITVKVSVPFALSVTINSATYTTIGSFPGISVSATNIWSTSQNLVVFAVWKNSASQTVAVTTGGLTLASGATGTAFAPLASALPSGTYTVNVFVITTSNNPVSSTTTITVTV